MKMKRACDICWKIICLFFDRITRIIDNLFDIFSIKIKNEINSDTRPGNGHRISCPDQTEGGSGCCSSGWRTWLRDDPDLPDRPHHDVLPLLYVFVWHGTADGHLDATILAVVRR